MQLTYIPGNTADTDPQASRLADTKNDSCIRFGYDKVYARVSVTVPLAPAHLVKIYGNSGVVCNNQQIMSAWTGSNARPGELSKFQQCSLKAAEHTVGSLSVCTFYCQCKLVRCDAVELLLKTKHNMEICEVDYCTIL